VANDDVNWTSQKALLVWQGVMKWECLAALRCVGREELLFSAESPACLIYVAWARRGQVGASATSNALQHRACYHHENVNIYFAATTSKLISEFPEAQ
jgi:hypothetical protein